MKLRLPLRSLRPNKTWIVLGVAVGLGLLAAGLARNYLSNQMAALEARAQGEKVSVVVAKTPLRAGDPLNPDTVAIRAVPKEYAQGSALRPEELDRFQGRQIAQPLASGEMILWSMLEGKKVPTFSARVADGRRAITVPVDEINSISGLLEPNDLIDLMVTVDHKGHKYTVPLLQAVTVLATGQRAVDDPQSGERRHYSTVTLDTSPQQAHDIVVARESGKLTALLRNPGDRREFRANSGDLVALLGLQSPQVASTVRQVPVLYGGRQAHLPPEGLQMGRYVQANQVTAPAASDASAQAAMPAMPQPPSAAAALTPLATNPIPPGLVTAPAPVPVITSPRRP